MIIQHLSWESYAELVESCAEYYEIPSEVLSMDTFFGWFKRHRIEFRDDGSDPRLIAENEEDLTIFMLKYL